MRCDLLLLLGLLPGALAVWPQPASSSFGKQFVKLDPSVQVVLDSATDDARLPNDLTQALAEAVKGLTTVPIQPLEVDRGASWKGQIDQAKTLKTVIVTVVELLKSTPDGCKRSQVPFDGANAAQAAQEADWENACSISSHTVALPSTAAASGEVKIDDTLPKDISSRDAESYELSVPSDGSSATLRAYTALGAYRGLKTLEQLAFQLHTTPDKTQNDLFIANAPISIQDRPAFPYRGLLIDTARNYLPVRTIKAQLDTMALVKLNQLHWHMTDSQSWPLSFHSDAGDLARLAEGAYDAQSTYDEADVRDVVDYAAARGVNVNVEIDMPGHMMQGVQALGQDFIACPDETDWIKVAAEPPSGQLNLRPNGSPDIPADISSLVSRLLARTATLVRSPYLSSGGDEPNLPCWGLAAGDEAKLDTETMAPFQTLVSTALSKANKKGMVWEEMATKFPTTAKSLPAGTLVEAWTTPDNAAKALAANPDVNLILAPYTHFYLDCGFGEWTGNSTGQSWCEYVGWQKTYSFDPYAGIKAEDQKRVLGGEHALWSETIDEFNIEQRAWPRAASGAEVFWTGGSFTADGAQTDRNGVQALERILELRVRLNQRGVAAEPLQPLWCVLRRGRCNMSS